MTDKSEMTALGVSVSADTEQSSQKQTNNSITEKSFDYKAFEKMQRELFEMLDPTNLKTISMTELYDTVYAESKPLIDGLLYQGTYIFVGSPKFGKSFLMAQIAYHISEGIPLWDCNVSKSKVLYLALEDTPKRLQKRLFRMFGAEPSENLDFAVSAGKLGNGLDEQLNKYMDKNPDTKLIIIDTLQKVRELGGESYSYSSDYETVTRLKSFADSRGITLLIVHHTRKQSADDAFDMISGTNGLLGAADGAFILQKEKRTSNSATLEVTGRDQPDQKYYLERDVEKLIWRLKEVETDLWQEPPEPLLETVAEKITEEVPEWSGTPSEMVELLGVDMKANALTYKLNINAGRLFNEYGIRYENKRCHDGRKVRLWIERRDDA